MTADDIRREIDASRRAIQTDYRALRHELDFVTKTKQSVAARPLPWLGGAALLGYLFSPRRKNRPARQKAKGGPEIAEPAKKLTLLGVGLAAGRLLFPVFRPALTAFALRKLSGFTQRYQ